MTGVLQGMVLSMCIAFEIRDWKERKHARRIEITKGKSHTRDDDDDERHSLGHQNADTEHTTLLGNER